jgi:hypothetical protein
MGMVFDACRRVLLRDVEPLHYIELTRRALALLGHGDHMLAWKRQIEDVREKFVGNDIFYSGEPHYLFGYRWWFHDRALVRPTDGVVIPASVEAGVNGSYEGLMRSPHMQVKTTAPLERVMRARARGLVIESHVRGYFAARFPGLYRPPPNEGQWTQVCGYDFGLLLDGRVARFDVSSRKRNGEYGLPAGGKALGHDYRILAEPRGDDVVMVSILGEPDLRSAAVNEEHRGTPPEHLLIRLYCAQNGIDYDELRRAAESERRSARRATASRAVALAKG